MGNLQAETLVDTLADTLTRWKAETLGYTLIVVENRSPCRYAGSHVNRKQSPNTH